MDSKLAMKATLPCLNLVSTPTMEKFGQIFIAQSAIGHHDLDAQIQKFWNICSNLIFKEDSIYIFPSLFRKTNSEIMHFLSRNQRFSLLLTMMGTGIR